MAPPVIAWLLLAILHLVVASTDASASGDIPTKTIIDVLSEFAQFSTLVSLLQRHSLVPVINQSRNSTLLAPINSAFAGLDLDTITRDQLLYHFVREVFLQEDYEDDEDGLVVPTYLEKMVSAPLRIRLGEINNGEADILQTDLLASPHRGVVHAVSNLLSLPLPACTDISLQQDLSIFSDLLELSADECGELGKGATVLAPIDSSLRMEFSEIEIIYLNSVFGAQDRKHIVESCVIPTILRPQNLPATVVTKDGSSLELQRNLSGSVKPIDNGAWRISLDGILAIVDGYPGAKINFTPEKYIQGLGGFDFVRAVVLYGHRSLIDGTHTGAQTIIIPQYSQSSDSRENKRSEFQTSLDPLVPVRYTPGDEALLYQFLKDQVSLNSSRVGITLLDTRMKLTSGKYPQRIHLERRRTGSIWLNWQQVTSREYSLGNTSIYTVDGSLSVPPRLAMALGPFFLTSHSLTFLDQLDLLTLPVRESWTLFLPVREAWDSHILLTKYLSQNINALSRVFGNFIVNRPVYTDTVGTVRAEQFQAYPTEIEVQDGTFLINGTTRIQGEITDILFDNGVAHIVKDFSLPPDLEITVQDLVVAGGRAEFLDLLRDADMDDLIRDPRNNFTLVVPNIKQLHKNNVSMHGMELPKLRKLLGMHLIEGNPFSEDVKDEFFVTTVADEDLEVHRISGDVFSLTPTAGSGQRVLVTARGVTNGEIATQSTVLFVDRYMSPDWINQPLIPPPFRLHTQSAILVGAILTMILVALGILGSLWYLAGGEKVDDNESSPVAGHSGEGTTPEATEDDDDVEEEGSEDPEPTTPIRTPGIHEERAFGRHLNLP